MDQTAIPRTMVIGGDSHFCYLMRRYLGASDHQLTFLNYGDDVLAVARQKKPTVIVLKVDEPGTPGWITLQALKSDQMLSHVPVVLCSWLADEMHSLEHGAEIYLRLPLLYNDFKSAMLNVGINLEGGG
jgi:CheY-like chemotaxis protein